MFLSTFYYWVVAWQVLFVFDILEQTKRKPCTSSMRIAAFQNVHTFTNNNDKYEGNTQYNVTHRNIHCRLHQNVSSNSPTFELDAVSVCSFKIVARKQSVFDSVIIWSSKDALIDQRIYFTVDCGPNLFTVKSMYESSRSSHYKNVLLGNEIPSPFLRQNKS